MKKRAIIRNIILLFGLLIAAIISSAAYLAFQENKTFAQYTYKDLDTKLKIADSIQNSEMDKLKGLIRIIREQNQKLVDFLDYDQLKSVTIMLQNMAHIHSIDFISLFDEDGNLLTTNRTGTDITNPSMYNILISDRQERTGVEEIPTIIFTHQFPNFKLKSDAAHILCFKSIVHLLHDTGDISGYVVLVKLINGNKKLMDKMAEISGAEILYYDKDFDTVASSFSKLKMPYPTDGIIDHEGKTYLVKTMDMISFRGQPVCQLAVALDNKPLLEQRRLLLWNIFLPFIVSAIISLALFFLLKTRVFDKISQLITALRHVAEGEGNLSIRVSIPSEKITSEDLDEVENMIIDFNHMMDKLEEAYSSLRYEIKERKHTEEELRESEEKYRSMMEAMKDSAYICSSRFRIEYMNQAMISRIGHDGTDELCHKAIYDNDEKCSWCLFDQVQQGKHVEYELANPRDSHYYSIINSPIFHSGEPISKLTICRDITESKAMEAQLRQTHKMEAIGTLAGGIAHQFNNALYAITGNIDLLEMDLDRDATVAGYTKEMKESTRRMAQLTAQLLAYARGGKYQAKTVSLSDFIRETLPLVKYAIDSAIHVDTDLPCCILNVKADLTQMQMVLSAVLTNASEAMKGKGGRIRVNYKKFVITDDTIKNVPGLKPGNYACLTITDDGTGMDEETRTRIFEPFFTTKFEGRGLGMAAAYGIVKSHDGLITVDSELDKGTTVKIYLPAVKTPVKEDVKKSPRQAEWVKGTGTILVIDDEEVVMTVCRAMLERMGYSVLEARSGQEAIDVVKTFDGNIDLAMLDILMPGMSGESVYPLLMKARPNLKVLVFSGYSIDGPVQKILDAGAQDFIQKPFTMADLSEKLKKTLGGEQ